MLNSCPTFVVHKMIVMKKFFLFLAAVSVSLSGSSPVKFEAVLFVSKAVTFFGLYEVFNFYPPVFHCRNHLVRLIDVYPGVFGALRHK